MENVMETVPAVIMVLTGNAFTTAEKILAHLPCSTVYSLAGRIPENNREYSSFAGFIQEQYKAGRTIIALCSTGIIIRSLAPVLNMKSTEPAVIAVAEDGSCVVPLLGATRGANRLAESLARALACPAAITTSGVLRFGINLLCPPQGLELLNPQHGKTFVAALLNGATVRVDGTHPWIDDSRLPVRSDAQHVIRILPPGAVAAPTRADELVYRTSPAGRSRGCVSIIGLGPGGRQFRTLASERALKKADDILGYDLYVDLAGPFDKSQTLHRSSNREELNRARHALALATEGHHAALVSSGDPGVFAMAAAFFEVWEQTDTTLADIDITIEPGISAAFAAAARFGAPLGHDFAMISLSDNLKSWDIIEKRLRLTSQADMILALYNPVSKSRNRPLHKAIQILRQERSPHTIIALAHDVARENEALKITTLGDVRISDITSRTVILVGSAATRCFRKNGRDWVYSPRHYGQT